MQRFSIAKMLAHQYLFDPFTTIYFHNFYCLKVTFLVKKIFIGPLPLFTTFTSRNLNVKSEVTPNKIETHNNQI